MRPMAQKGLIYFREVKPATVNQQCLVYKFQCNLCDAGYVGYTSGHTSTNALIGKHYLSEHNSNVPPCLSEKFMCLLNVLTNLTA